MESGGPVCVTLPDFIKIGQAAAEILHFNGFLKMAAVGRLEFSEFEYLTAGGYRRPILRHCAIFRKDQSNRR